MEGRLDRLESEVGAEDEASEAESDESVVMDEQAYTELAGGDKHLAQQLQARDELLQEKLEGAQSEGLSKTVGRKTAGAAAGMVVGTALGGPAGTLVGAAVGAAAERKSGPPIEKGQSLARQLPDTVRSGFTTVESKASEYRDWADTTVDDIQERVFDDAGGSGEGESESAGQSNDSSGRKEFN
ncbi:hypothetical protein [Halorhabdus sp. CUG00001]|uniref:hypothetical protein n=1 Tax=Halorhabdus sp. CUG00001 TaxID=2600297 RepID=UPI00131D9E76|nr:hypothetical protein [Halorhabdus sp. CUG00001]